MKTKNIIIFSIILAGTLIATSCGNKGNAEEDKTATTEVTSKSHAVKVKVLESKVVERTLNYTANIISFEELYLAPASPGRIQKIYPEVGDRVVAGQIIAEMDPTQLNQAKLQLISLERDFERMDTLLAVGGVSKQQYDQVKTQLDVTRSNVQFLEENVHLKTPFNGIVTGKYFEDGELYSGAPNTQVGKAAIVTLQQIQPVKAVINVSEKYFPVLSENMKAKVLLDIYPDDVFEGTIYRIYPTMNAATRTFQVEVKINNLKEKIRPGMFARVEMEIGEEETLIVPVSAVMQQSGTNNRYLFVVENGIARKVMVTSGVRFDEEMEVISDELSAGDQIIVAGQVNLIDGDAVEIVK
jgi:RND family efflux transporter MFP subunit